MKKYLILFLIFCLLLTVFTGCGRKQSLSRYTTVMHRDIPIALNAPAAPILAALGAPFGYGESKSGVYHGVEKTYEFTGLRVKTFQSGDEERILGVMITGSSMQTPDGIAIGDPASRVAECFGADAIQNDCCVVSRSQERMVVLLEHNVVTAIQYTLA